MVLLRFVFCVCVIRSYRYQIISIAANQEYFFFAYANVLLFTVVLLASIAIRLHLHNNDDRIVHHLHHRVCVFSPQLNRMSIKIV